MADAQDGIKEKCARIRQILLELQIEEEVPEPGLQEAEDPDSVLKVQDKEITVEKWISPEERLGFEDARQFPFIIEYDM